MKRGEERYNYKLKDEKRNTFGPFKNFIYTGFQAIAEIGNVTYDSEVIVDCIQGL